MATTVIAAADTGWTITGAPSVMQHATSKILGRLEVLYSGEDKSWWRRSIFRFDLTPVAGLTLTNATLTRQIVDLLGGGGHTTRFSRVTDAANVGDDPCWIDQDHSELDPWGSDGGDYDHAGPPAGLEIVEPLAIGVHVITDAGLLTLVQDARANRDNVLMLISYLDNEDPGVNTGTHWSSPVTLTLTSPDPPAPEPIEIPTAHRNRVTLGAGDRGHREGAPTRPQRPRSPMKPRRPRQ